MKTSNITKLISYALLMFLAFMLASLLTTFYVPIKQYFAGQPADFAKQWQQTDIMKKVLLGLTFTAVLTVSRYLKERKKSNTSNTS